MSFLFNNFLLITKLQVCDPGFGQWTNDDCAETIFAQKHKPVIFIAALLSTKPQVKWRDMKISFMLFSIVIEMVACFHNFKVHWES
jgi:hypothetical protein